MRPLLFAAACLPLALTACSDQFAPVLPQDAQKLTGISDAAPGVAGCGAMTFDVSHAVSPISDVDRIAGRARMVDPPASLANKADTLWVEGYMDKDQMVQIEVRELRPYVLGDRVYTLWRGHKEGESLVLAEPQPSCGRRVILAAAG
ncbi:MAG: hypothetical protein U1E14_12185 [Geminicoccaceae bacterium]